MKFDVLIIGGGPSGMNAALEAEANGLQTALVDEGFSLGGHLKYQTKIYEDLPSSYSAQRGTTIVEKLAEKLAKSTVQLYLNHTMIGIYGDGTVGVTDGKHTFPIEAEKVIIATGFAEEGQLFPGWTKPGVMTVGAALKMVNYEHVLPGKNALILGSNDYALEAAKQLTNVGIQVHGIIEGNNEVVSKNERLIENLKQLDIPIYTNSAIVGVEGPNDVEKVTIDHNGNEETLVIDVICIGKGLTPIIEALELYSCEVTHSKVLGGFIPKYAETLETSTPSVYVAGNAAGITCLGADLLLGQIAANSVAAAVGKLTETEANKRSKAFWEELVQLEADYSTELNTTRLSIINDFHKEQNKDFMSLSDIVAEVL